MNQLASASQLRMSLLALGVVCCSSDIVFRIFVGRSFGFG